jgi:hypothetical protein
VTETKEMSVFVAPAKTEVTETKEMSVFVAPALLAATRANEPRTTSVMNAVDQELLAKLTRSDGEVERLVRRTGEHEVVDDGLRTNVMDAVDPAALGLELAASGSFPVATGGTTPEGDDDEPAIGSSDSSASSDARGPSSPGGPGPAGSKKRRKRR